MLKLAEELALNRVKTLSTLKDKLQANDRNDLEEIQKPYYQLPVDSFGRLHLLHNPTLPVQTYLLSSIQVRKILTFFDVIEQTSDIELIQFLLISKFIQHTRNVFTKHQLESSQRIPKGNIFNAIYMFGLENLPLNQIMNYKDSIDYSDQVPIFSLFIQLIFFLGS